ncbi:unnamed protein product [Lampetra fluviatilis]
MTLGLGDEDSLPDRVGASEFYQKYNPMEILGRGVSSVVRRCVSKATGGEFAVKIIDLAAELLDAEQVDEIRSSTHTEVDILRRVAGHPHIIQLIDCFESSTVIFLVFDLMRKGELFDDLTEKVSLSEKETRRTMRAVLEVVRYLHDEVGVVHRDLKPENLLLDSSGEIKLSDFGFACCLPAEGQPQLRELYGTPGYLAPEMLQCSMEPTHPGYGKEVDMWACGVITYTLLAGSPPFWHRKQLLMLRLIMEGRYQMSSPTWDDKTSCVKDLISRMLCVDPLQRLTAAQALAHPFFQSYSREQRPGLSPLRRFRVGGVTVCAVSLAILAALRIRSPPPPLPVTPSALFLGAPHALLALRRCVDAAAFRLYGHWVKRGQRQDRAALFEDAPRAAGFEWRLCSPGEKIPPRHVLEERVVL